MNTLHLNVVLTEMHKKIPHYAGFAKIAIVKDAYNWLFDLEA